MFDFLGFVFFCWTKDKIIKYKPFEQYLFLAWISNPSKGGYKENPSTHRMVNALDTVNQELKLSI